MRAPLLIEIGCEEIPARVIPLAAGELGRRVEAVLDQAGLSHGAVTSWGGSRRLSVRVEEVEGRQGDREETVLGPPAAAAFEKDGTPTPSAAGFARKHGATPGDLLRVTTDRGEYVGLRRAVPGRALGAILAESLPSAVEGMAFPKTMRWGDGRRRWVRPVHWLVALHGREALGMEILGISAGRESRGHRFLAPQGVRLEEANDYAGALERAFVVADPASRRRIVSRRLAAAAEEAGGDLVEDERLLDEVVDLVEWPGVVTGTFDARYLDLPREILVTTLRHHQKAFSVQRGGRLLPVFLAVANTDRDPAGHIRRGNEWVVGGRLEDARFFWGEDREKTLASRLDRLGGIVYHAKAGTYREKADRLAALADALARAVGRGPEDEEASRRAATLCKADLVTGVVAEFPELQGVVGGLLLRAEGDDERVASAVYEHYRPQGPADPLPESEIGAIVAVADKLDSVASLLAAGERPTGSRDPFGLRRATAGLFRIACARSWPVSLDSLGRWVARTAGESAADAVLRYLEQRFRDHLREQGFAAHEIQAVLLAGEGSAAVALPIDDVLARLEAVRGVRDRSEFPRLVELTKRASNITKQTSEILDRAKCEGWAPSPRSTWPEAARALEDAIQLAAPQIEAAAARRQYEEVLRLLAGLADPVDAFFEEVLVVDREDLSGTYHRHDLLVRLGSLLTRYFDIRELPGEADRRP